MSQAVVRFIETRRGSQEKAAMHWGDLMTLMPVNHRTQPQAEQLPWIERADLLFTNIEVVWVHYADTLLHWYRNFRRN